MSVPKLILCLGAALSSLVLCAADKHLYIAEIAADRADCVYQLGQEATFTVKITEEDGQAPVTGKVKWEINNFGKKVFKKGEFDFAAAGTNVFTVSGAQDEPGFLRLDVTPCKGKSDRGMWGVVYNPTEIRPGAPCPEDFMDYWKNAIATYDRDVSAPIEAVEMERDAKTTMWMLKIPSTDGRTVYGYYSEPNDTSKGPFALNISVPGAGPAVYGCKRYADSCTLLLNVHYYDPTALKGVPRKQGLSAEMQDAEDKAYTEKFPAKKTRYTYAGISSPRREDFFYYGCILAANRAIDWAATRPCIDSKRVWYAGGSQGGGMGLILTGLNKRITRAEILVPALTDHLGHKASNRQPGWPGLVEVQFPENVAMAEKNAPYFDGANFARYITCPIAFEVGFIDLTTTPNAGYSAYNVCPAKEKIIVNGIGHGHNVFDAPRQKVADWIRQH